MALIKERRVTSDSWRLLEPGPSGEPPEVPAEGAVIVPLSLWVAKREELRMRRDRVGVWLEPHEEPAVLAADLAELPLVAVKFPKFDDGRGYSTARLLRERYGYRGELRAIGQVLRDQLYFMAQCGFDAFALREDQDAAQALAAFDEFSDGYQTSVLRPQPLFRRRASGAEP